MDPTAQNDQQNPVAQPVQPAPPAPAPTTGSTGYVKKESEPVPVTNEIIQPVEQAPVIEKELAEIGVEKVQSEPNLTLADQKAGFTLAKESTPYPTAPTGIVKLPLTDEEMKQAKKLSPKFSVRWLEEMLEKIKLKMKKGGTYVA